MKALTFAAAGMALAAVAEKPNVVLIMTDDQGYGDFGFTGNKIFETPHADKMAAENTFVQNYYVSPVCSPTRASLMTGRYNGRTGVVDTWMGRSVMNPAETTLAELLKSNGYATSIYGKWHLGDSYPARSMDQGFDENLVHLGGGIGQPCDKFGYEGRYTDPILYHNGEQVVKKGYCTDIFFDESIKWMKQQQKLGKPFFTYITPNAPHSPFHDVPEDLYQKYLKKDLASLITYPEKLKDENHKKREIDTLARIGAMITNIDDNMGKLDKFLEDSGLAENTIVLFMTDNGPNTYRYAGGFKGKKSNVEKAGIRTPLLIKWNKLKKGVINSSPVAHIDIFPTLAAACGVEIPKDNLPLDGQNILPLINDGKTIERDIVIQFHRGTKLNREENFTILNNEWKLNHQTLYMPKGMDEPFHLYRNDDKEQKDVYAEYPEQVEKMMKAYHKWFDDIEASRPEPTVAIVGTEHEKISMLTRQDFIWVSGNSWYGKASGYWPIETKKGFYKITVHTEASNKPIDAVLTYKGLKKEFTFPANATSVTFKDIKLEGGKGDMECKMKYHDHERGAYQIILERNWKRK